MADRNCRLVSLYDAVERLAVNQVSLRPLGRDLVITFFDAEEPPHYLGQTMGSRRFVEDYCGEIQTS